MNTRGGRKTPTINALPNGTTTNRRSGGAAKRRTTTAGANSKRRNNNGGLKSIGEDVGSNSDSSISDQDHNDDTSVSNHSSTTCSSADSSMLNLDTSAPKITKPSPRKPTGKRRLPPSTSSASLFSNCSADQPAPPTKRSRNNSQTSAAASGSSPADLQIELHLYGTVKSVLATQYFNVVERLQLDFQPSCLSNLEYCAQYHSRNGVSIPNR